MKSWLLALAFVASATGSVVMAQQSPPTSSIVRKDLLTAALAQGAIRFQVEGQPVQLLTEGSAFFEPAGAKVLRFDNASTDAPATIVAFYLLGPDDRQIIEMLD